MKIINVPVGFPDDFFPPDKFDGMEERWATGQCLDCPFYWHDTYESDEGCAILHMSEGYECPIRPLYDN